MLRLTTDGHNASRGLSATAELLVSTAYSAGIHFHVHQPSVGVTLFTKHHITLEGQIQGKKVHGRPRTMLLDWLLKTEEGNISYEELKMGWRGGLVVGRWTCDLRVAGSRPGRDAAA